MAAAEVAMLPRVLVALDGSPAAARALPVARAVARQLGAEVAICHVAPAGVAAPALDRNLHAALHADETLQLASGVGGPAAGVLEAAADPAVVLLVLTTHGRAIEPRAQLGRVARAVIAQTTRPVLLVRPEAAEDAHALRRLLIPLDGTPTMAAALRPGSALASRLGAAIDLLYVVDDGRPPPDEAGTLCAPRYVDQPQHEWTAWAQEVQTRFGHGLAEIPAEIPVRVYLARGAIGPEIARFAAEHDIDAVVVVRRSHLEPGRAPVLQAVLRLTPCPVLLLSGSPD